MENTIPEATTRQHENGLRGKTILVVGSGGLSKLYLFEKAKKFGVKTVLVEPYTNDDNVSKCIVDHFIYYDFLDHTKDETHAENIVQLVAREAVTVDGCLTLIEDNVPLTAYLCEKLKMRGTSPVSAMIVKDKSLTQKILGEDDANEHNIYDTKHYIAKALEFKTADDIDFVSEQISFPAVFKPVYGCASVGVQLVHNKQECHEAMELLRNEHQNDLNTMMYLGLNYTPKMLLMEYLDGTKHVTEVIIFNGELLAAFTADYAPTCLPYFMNTATTMPSVLSANEINAVIETSYRCCVNIGLTDGVYDVEVMMTEAGPKLIEINGRPSASHPPWIESVYNVDIVKIAMMIALGIKPDVGYTQPTHSVVTAMCLASVHGHALSNDSILSKLQILQNCGEIIYSLYQNSVTSALEEGWERLYSNIAVIGDNLEDAKQNLLSIFEELNLTCNDYPLEKFINSFQYRYNEKLVQNIIGDYIPIHLMCNPEKNKKNTIYQSKKL